MLRAEAERCQSLPDVMNGYAGRLTRSPARVQGICEELESQERQRMPRGPPAQCAKVVIQQGYARCPLLLSP
jgi:hypothetical protein